MNYDSGDFPAVLEAGARRPPTSTGFAARKRESEARGKLRGLGIGYFLEVTAPPGKEMGGIRFEAERDVTIITGTLDYGQGHAAPFAQVLREKLGIPFERIRLVQGDSDQLIAGGGTGGSRSITASGAAIVEAVRQGDREGQGRSPRMCWKRRPPTSSSRDGRFVIAGTDRAIGIMELADKLRAGLKLPDGVPHTLDVSHRRRGRAVGLPERLPCLPRSRSIPTPARSRS